MTEKDSYNFDVLVVGAGLTGAVIARELAEAGFDVGVIDSSDKIGGALADFIDPHLKQPVPIFGGGIFKSNNEYTWNYIKQFGKFHRARWTQALRVDSGEKKENKSENVFDINLPFDAESINVLANTHLRKSHDFLSGAAIIYQQEESNKTEYDNFDDILQERFKNTPFYELATNVTQKYWGVETKKLSPIFTMPPFDFTICNDPQQFEAVPDEGWTKLITNILNHDNIKVQLCTDYFGVRHQEKFKPNYMTFYTGPLDVFEVEVDGVSTPIEYRTFEFHFLRASGIFMFKQVQTWYSEHNYSYALEPKHLWKGNYDGSPIIMVKPKKPLCNNKDNKTPMVIVPTFENDKALGQIKQRLRERYYSLESPQCIRFVGHYSRVREDDLDMAIFWAHTQARNAIDDLKEKRSKKFFEVPKID